MAAPKEIMAYTMENIKQRKYRRLDINFSLTEELELTIGTFMQHINEESGTSEDCYRSEIDFWLKDALGRKKICRDQYELLKDYYVHGGIYAELGNPAYGKRLKTQNL